MNYGQAVKEAAREMRLRGIGVADVAHKLGVSAGWASNATSAVRVPRAKSLFESDQEEFERDSREHSATRARRLEEAGPKRKLSLEARGIALRTALNAAQGGAIPDCETPAYKQLDRLQQTFAKDPTHPLFGVIARTWPALLAHVIEWHKTCHKQTQDKSDELFRAKAKRVHDYVMANLQPPSVADKNLQIQSDARWLWRWKSNANSRIGRRRNVERAQLFSEIGLVLESLRSPVPEVYGEGVRVVRSGRWTAVFNALMSTRNDYSYERL